ncbi:alpha-1,3-mannosyl-glycoprotein 4-beta-N-acetylglucosaminyltransferase-like protein MGAT4D [Pteropus medius]|uniref:alpha-1,3-mannosyl-glycoprotein 4-beta-N-acetylglucosaminyltransferase-like protein MGAT4D n=1 Tax=Pteropus vampyrus TaxID=132908 RepID=UPI00196AACD9|nr:alpha-1,3-mannosyl-glycoprotein 4-beta-N-acetylglucosaminyltransferase-like protein MGAT4D [Pteropus giganteus]
MRAKRVNLLIALVAVMLFSFSCFCISKMTQTSKRRVTSPASFPAFPASGLQDCSGGRVGEEEGDQTYTSWPHPGVHLQAASQTFHQLRDGSLSVLPLFIWQHETLCGEKNHYSSELRSPIFFSLSAEKTVSTLDENKTVSNTFEVLKFFFPHLRKAGRLYPDVIIGKEKTGVSLALGISTVRRGSRSHLKQVLTSLVSRMTLAEEKDSVVIVSVADSNEDYLTSVVDMITKKFKRQLKSGSLEVISIPAFFYPDMSHARQSTEDSQKLDSWQIKQVLDFCFLMLYAQPKAMYYLQLEDDVIAKNMYFTKITDFIHNISSNNWFYIEFSILGFVGKLFKSEDLTDFVRFFLMFYKDKPIDVLLGDIFRVKKCSPEETLEKCTERNKQIRIQYKPSLFQHVGELWSSFPITEQNSITK